MSQDVRIGAYRIIREIKRGGQGSVYLGYDQRLSRQVAIKIIALPRQTGQREALLDEARLLASVEDSRVVKVHDVMESSGHIALVMEYVPGCDLAQLLAGTTLSLSSILVLGLDVTAALAAARQRGIVHGDLKPANILVSTSGRAKLGDFGISRRILGTAAEHGGAGSTASMSPEQYRQASLDFRSDLFSLGCLLYRLISGVQPFHHGGRLDPDLLLHQDPPAPVQLGADGSEVPQQVVDLVMSLLQKNPADRPASTHQVRRELRNASKGLPLASFSRLLEESRGFFRPESEDDIPLQVPEDISLQGQTSLGSTGAGHSGRWELSRVAVVLGVVALLGFTAAFWLQSARDGESLVHIEVTEVAVDSQLQLPASISTAWLVEQLREAAERGLGPVRVAGPVGASPVTVLHAGGAATEHLPVREYLRATLRCSAPLCVVGLERQPAGDTGFLQEQVLLFPDAGIEQWHRAVQAAARQLFFRTQ